MAILTNSGRAALAAAIMAKPIHMAWGSGNAAWDSVPVPVTTLATALENEIGRRTATQVKYCTPQAGGELIVPTGEFTESPTPTKYFYMRFNFDFVDAPTSSIREVAVFSDTQLVAGLPVGQRYFPPSSVQSAGILMVIERISKFDRLPSIRQSFEFVIEI